MTVEPWTRIITVQRLVELHAEGLRLYGGDSGGPTPGTLEARAGAAWHATIFAPLDDPQGSIPDLGFAAYLLFYLATTQCFLDGNKRVAWLAAQDIIGKHGLTVGASPSEAYEFMLDIAKGHIDSANDVLRWMAARLTAET